MRDPNLHYVLSEAGGVVGVRPIGANMGDPGTLMIELSVKTATAIGDKASESGSPVHWYMSSALAESIALAWASAKWAEKPRG